MSEKEKKGNTAGWMGGVRSGPPTKKQLKALWEKAKELQAQGLSYQEINAKLNEATGGTDTTPGQVPGLASLELQIYGDKGAPSIAEKLAGFGATIYNGLTMGGGDELIGGMAAGMATIPGGREPQEAYDLVRQGYGSARDRTRAEHPVATMVAEGAGALGPGIAGAGLLSKAGLLGAGKTGGLIGRSLGGGARLGAAGAVEGGIYGALDAEQGGRAQGALTGGALGIATGGALGLMGPSMGIMGTKGLETVANKVPAARNALTRDADRRAGAAITRNLTQGRQELDLPNRTPQELADAVRSAPPGSRQMVVDEDAPLFTIMREAFNSNPATKAPGGPLQALTQRAAGAGRRLATTLRRGSGLVEGPGPEVWESTAKQAWRASDLEPFESALRAAGKDETFGSMKLGAIRKAWDGVENSELAIDHYIKLGGDMGRLPQMKWKNAWQTLREIEKDLKKAYRAGNLNEIDDLKGMREDWLALLDDSFEGFSPIRQTYRAIISRRDAYDNGALSAGTTKSLRWIRESLDGLTPANREAFQEGFTDTWERNMRQSGSGGRAVREMAEGVDDTYTLDKVRYVFGKDHPVVGQMKDALERDFQQAQSYRAAIGNSSTAEQLAQNQIEMVATRMPSLKQGLLEMALADPGSRIRVGSRATKQLVNEDPGPLLRAVDLSEQFRRRQAKIYGVGSAARTGSLLGPLSESQRR